MGWLVSLLGLVGEVVVVEMGCAADGFRAQFGFGLGASVNDIEGETDFGPFVFDLDPPSKKSNKKPKQ